MIEIDGKHYKLEEAFVIPENETSRDWEDVVDRHYVWVATDRIWVKKAFVLVEVEP